MIAVTSEFIAMGAFAAALLSLGAFFLWCAVQMKREDES